MRFTACAALLALFCSITVAQNATVVTNNPAGIEYQATLPNSNTTDVRGSLVAQSNPSGEGALFQVSFSGFPTEGGPFLYHIHVNNTCDAPGGHLDPFDHGETPACDSAVPEACQVGDLSGKHGTINDTSFSANYVDDYVSMVPNTPAFIGNRTIVVHFANKTIITCAPLELVANATNITSNSTATGSTSSGTSSASSTGTATLKSSATGSTASGSASASSSSSTGGAAILALDASAVIMGLMVLIL